MSDTPPAGPTAPASSSAATLRSSAADAKVRLQARSAELEQNHDALKKRLAAEKVAIAARRGAAYKDADEKHDLPQAGLALSGGGIRSATFCLGLIQGLARNGLLRRFDYLSTVSGGGYIGASVGRLIGMVGIDKAEALLGSGYSQVLGWLRKNGRYLTPSGARDLGMAIATLLRSSLSTHFELGLLAMLLGLFVILPHALQSQFVLFDDTAWEHWQSAWWPFAIILWVLAAPGAIWAFWPLRDPVRQAPTRTIEPVAHIALALAVVVISGVGVVRTYQPRHGWIAGLDAAQLCLLAACGALAWGLYVARQLWPLRNAAVAPEDIDFRVNGLRNLLTRALRWTSGLSMLCLLLGVLDWLSFSLVEKLQTPTWWRSLLPTLLAAGGALVVGMRNLSEPLKKALSSTDGDKGKWLRRAINATGLLIGGLLLLAWTALLQWLVLFDADSNVLFHGIPPFWCVLFILAVVLTWIFLTRRHNESLNASTLHGFYRARLIRAYLSIGNANRFPNIQAPYLGVIEANSQSVVDVVEGDDVSLSDYRPETRGGPIHLVGTCLNQTIDDHGDLYNADRKGIAAIVSAGGVEIGPGEAGSWESAQSAATLGQWVTISGAAVSPGAGSNTTRGWALLLFVFGVRLGYWTASLLARGDAKTKVSPSLPRTAPSDVFKDTKSGLVLSEALASFSGRPAKWWYLSDGGHFENTGVYALIKREVPFILMADCGADPKYAFEDLENLARKARIDFDAEIEIYTAQEAAARFGPFDDHLCVLSPEQIIDNHTRRGVLLARICYHRSDPLRRSYGTLLIVKPNLHDALDTDVLAYAGRNPAFPQQSTGDQFFDEAQWESYRRLGEDVGRALTDAWLGRLPHWGQATPQPSHDASLPRRREKIVETPADNTPSWRRTAAATAIGTTLSLSVVASMAGVGWTLYDGINKERKDTAAQIDSQIGSAKDSFSKLRGALCKVKTANKIHECVGMPPGTVNDLSPSDGQTLRELYETVNNPVNQTRLGAIFSDIRELQQTTCGMPASECPAAEQTAENLCSAICDRPVESDNTGTYWGMSGKSYDWNENALIAFVRNLAPGSGFGKASQEQIVLAPAAAPESTAATIRPRASGAAPTAPTQAAPHPDTPAPDSSTAARMPATTAGAASTTPAAANQGLSACKDGTEPVAVYIQIYDERSRHVADGIRGILKESAAVVVPRIENVVTTAQARGRRTPIAWKAPTLLVHRPDRDMQCAGAIVSATSEAIRSNYPDSPMQIRDLPASFKSTRHVLELWLAPPAATGEASN
ncbi:MAG: hypothetical protein JSS42_10355 [Proteobacteria bacterium]|nr:hypothetical protein [Pseudomonadota bacterium]